MPRGSKLLLRMLREFLKKQKQKGRSTGFLIVASLLLGAGAYAVVAQLVQGYRFAGLVGIGMVILSVVVWNIIYDRMGL